MRRLVLYKSLSKQYIFFKCKLRRNRQILSIVKLAIVLVIFFISVIVYWYFVNVWSTKWYFLRKEMSKLENTKLLYNVVKLEVLKKESMILNKINLNNVKYKIFYLDIYSKD